MNFYYYFTSEAWSTVISTDTRLTEWVEDMDKRINVAVENGMDKKIIRSGSPVVIVTGWRAGSGFTNTIRIIKVPEDPKKKGQIKILSSQNVGGMARDKDVPKFS